MSKGVQQDSLIFDDDEEETCPLCVEEFDLTDKGFKPCPCGYQICQFCYNNVKNNMNGLCPACRRPYNDKDIEYKVITPEETAIHRARQVQKQKKNLQAQLKEKQKAEADSLSRKHLAGLRVVQKNLVYVTGLSPKLQEEELLHTLRGDTYFGQYRKIIKIVVSKARDRLDSVGVYVTYEKKEDAASCIAAVDGSPNGDRTLRAQFGTTKYCSAYLRGDACMNRNCMFLHEAGEAGESYSRADLSSMNAGSTQQGSSRPPPPQSQQPMSAATQMVRTASDQPQSPTADRPALPSTASWASRPPQMQPSRTESRNASGSMDSPALPAATPALPQPEPSPPSPVAEPEPEPVQEPEPEPEPQPAPQPVKVRKPRAPSPIRDLVRLFNPQDLCLEFSTANMPQSEIDILTSYPALFDSDGGAKRRLRRQKEEEQRRIELEQAAAAAAAAVTNVETDDDPEMSGSMQLGGEPEEKDDAESTRDTATTSGQDMALDQRFQFGGVSSPAGISERGLTPQQHQQLLLQTMKSPSPGSQGTYMNQTNGAFQQTGHAPGHQRNVSRFSFANDSSASTAVKPVANQKLMSQQSAMMPPNGINHFGGQQHAQNGQFFTSNVQGPPPGLKASGTPPVSGGMTFGQGHGFTTGGIQYGSNVGGRNVNEEMMRDLLRGRNASVTGSDAAKQDDADFPPLAEFSTPSRRPSFSSLPQFQESRRSTPAIPPGLESEVASRRGTPTIPPGFSKPPTALPDLEGTGSRPSSRASIRRAASGHIVPAIPLRPGTPGATPSRAASRAASPSKKDDDDIVHETPTKKSRVAGSRVLDQAKAIKEAEVDAQVSKPTPKENEKPSTKLGPIKAPRSVADVVKSKKDDKEVSGDSKAAVADAVEQPLPSKSKKGKANEEKKPVIPSTSQAIKEPQQVQKEESKTVPATPAKVESKADATKRKHLGKLDIAAAVDKQSQTTSTAPADIGTPNKQQRTISQPPSAPSIPASPSVGVSSPVIKTLPRTLRVVQTATPKTEAPPAIPSAPTPSAVAAGKLPSRKPSVASMNFPGTPSSEHVSDNMSMTSASQSRANSPPVPGVSRVGSAPIREKTKSQQKKDRQERAKAKEEEEKARLLKGDAIAEEPAQEAIVSRKKKEKKEKAPKPVKPKEVVEKSEPVTTDTTPTVSRPVSPGPQEKEVPAKIETPMPTPIRTPSMPLQSPHEPSPPPTPTLSPAQIVAELRAAKPEIQKALDSLFRTSGAASLKSGQNIIPKDLSNPASWKTDFNIKLTKDEVDALLKHAVPAIQYGGEEGRIWDRGMVTSSGAHIRALNQELERRFLDLEGALQSMPDELKWRPTKPQNETRFPSFDLEALKRDYENANARGVSVMEAMVQDGSSMKKGAFLVDEASRYINEFVMPPATPPPSVGGGSNSGRQQQGGSQQQQQQVPAMQTEIVPPPTVEQAEKQLQEARKASDEKETNLKKAMRRNKKALGLGN